MRHRLAFAVLTGVLLVTLPASFAQQATAPAPVDFVRDVRPILEQHCFECHGPDKQMNGFRLDRRRDALRGGTIPVIMPGSALSSRLYLRLVGTTYGRHMPLDADPLEPAKVETIKKWIEQGAPWPDSASGDVVVPPLDAAAVKAFEALRTGDRAGFVAALKGGPVASLRGPGGATPLMAAALYGDAPLVRELLEAGAKPNLANDAGATALMWAANDLDKVRLLVDKGADVNARSNDGRSPLIIAASFRGNHEVVEFLLDRGANPSVQAPGLVGPITAITEAAKQGDEATIRLLIERGSDVARAGFAALGFAMRSRCDGCVGAIAARLPPALFTPAMALAAPPLGPALATIPMLERGANPNVRNPAGYPMILLAAASEAMPIDAVNALIARGADVNAASPFGETPLTVARRHGTTPMVEALLKAGGKDLEPANVRPIPSGASSAREAVMRSLPLLQRADEQFLRTAGCVSCHNNSQTAMTIALARTRRFPLDEAIAARQLQRTASYVDDWRERAILMQGVPGDSDSMASLLGGLAAERHAPDAATLAMARFIRYQQAPDGRWPAFAHRPPIESGDVAVTVESMHALRAYGVGTEARLAAAAIARGATWLAQARPVSLPERAFLALGLGEFGAAKPEIAAAARNVIAMQRADGGWAQLPSLASDAYATGLAVSALIESGALAPTDPVIQRAVQFLLKTQFADGSWYVQRRAIPVQPYFDAGFPYGKDQFISAAATNWATRALLLSAKRGT